jgi:hypothetical protein
MCCLQSTVHLYTVSMPCLRFFVCCVSEKIKAQIIVESTGDLPTACPPTMVRSSSSSGYMVDLISASKSLYPAMYAAYG